MDRKVRERREEEATFTTAALDDDDDGNAMAASGMACTEIVARKSKRASLCLCIKEGGRQSAKGAADPGSDAFHFVSENRGERTMQTKS